MKTRRASKIAKELNNTKKWHSHSYGISITELENDLKLQIEDFGKIPARADAIHNYHDLLWDCMKSHHLAGVLHSKDGIEPCLPTYH